jgi:type II secretory pathway pseudopilin PulG
MRGNAGLTRGELLVICIMILVIAALAVPGLIASHRKANEREAAVTLKALASAQADFKTNDRDKNGVNDFWTADVKGLYTMTGANIPGSADASIKLIEHSVAAADGDGTFFAAGGENMPLSVFATPKKRSGYWYLSMLTEHSPSGSEVSTYALDTGGKLPMGSVHNASKFGFTTFADSPSGGESLYIVNEANTIFRHILRKAAARIGTDVPPGRKGLRDLYQHWPDDNRLKRIALLCCGGCHCPDCGYAGEHDP